MSHKPILIENLSLSFSHKTCFDEFSTQIHYGDRIAIIGRNGSGKSSLLQMLKEYNINIGYVPQIMQEFDNYSGGERFNKYLSQIINLKPDLLLLDEPTNHLDQRNRRSLMRMLEHFPGTIIIASHDTELLRKNADILWHIDNGKINIFSGNYDDYMRKITIERESVERELCIISKDKKEIHNSLMKEQKRSKNARLQGEKHIKERKWPTIVSDAKARRAEETSGNKKLAISQKKKDLLSRLSELYLPEIIKPKFSISAADVGSRNLIYISEASCGYDTYILENIFLSLNSNERIAIIGDNGSGKSTLVKAILGDNSITKTGNWELSKIEDIGYLDQHYSNINSGKTVFETIKELVPNWYMKEIRSHLNDFLFRKNEEVNCLVSNLSGGEKARLSLAKIAAKTPKLLLLDEVTNNIDLDTKNHVIEILKNYPGALIVISHDEDFLDKIGVIDKVNIESFKAV